MGTLKYECCSCNQYAPDEDGDSQNIEQINQHCYIGVGLLTITFLLLSVCLCLSIYLSQFGEFTGAVLLTKSISIEIEYS